MAKISEGKYVFRVAPKVNKPMIAQAIKNLYKVDTIKVNIINSKSEAKIVRGRYQSKTRASKKAIITLKKGQKISGFEEK